MSKNLDLQKLLATLHPVLTPSEFVFITLSESRYGDEAHLNPIASFHEHEGLTLIVRRESADEFGKPYNGVFRMITLNVHSDLEAVGLTAAVAKALTKQQISANVVAAFHHDHIFVPADRADDAIAALEELMANNQS